MRVGIFWKGLYFMVIRFGIEDKDACCPPSSSQKTAYNRTTDARRKKHACHRLCLALSPPQLQETI